MKKYLLPAIIMLTFQNVFAQNAYYDALFISQFSNTNALMILDANSKYESFNLSELQESSIKNLILFLTNPFDDNIDNNKMDILSIKKSINAYNSFINTISDNEFNFDTYMQEYIDGATTKAILGLIPNALSGNFSLNSEDQTKILDGLVKYYAEEFKKARLLTYMQTFESTIGKVGELQVLFPNTFDKLKNTNPSKFPELGDEYKEIFSQDLKSLIDNLMNHIKNHKCTDLLESKLTFLNAENSATIKGKSFYGSLELSADISSKLINNYHPVDLFNYLDNKYYHDKNMAGKLGNTTTLDEKLALIIHGINFVQTNLLDTTKSKSSQYSNVWLSFQDFNKINTISEWNFFAGLMYQQDKDFFKEAFFTPDSYTLSIDTIKKIKKTFTKILSSLNQIQELRMSLNDENLNETYLEYMKIVTEVFEQANIKNDDITQFFKVSSYSLHLYDNARSKDYSNSIHYVTLILNEFLGTNPTYLETIQQIDKYGTFMTDVINSENSDEVKEVIKKHAAPPASFILKREYAGTFSITGQPGYFFSAESLNDNWGFVSGITLPMGFEYTFKMNKGQENSPSLGLFLQLIDLGAMMNFRVSDSTSELPDKVEFSQIFSPGGSLTYGFKNSPLNLGLGYQYSPELRTVTLENGNETFPNGHRVFLRLAWDIPLINIYKSKKN